MPILSPHVNESELGYTAAPIAVQRVVARRRTGRMQETEDRRQEAGDRRQETGDGRQEAEDRRQKTEDRRQKEDNNKEGLGTGDWGSGTDRSTAARSGGLTIRRVGIRVGLLQVRNLAEKTAQNIVEQRKQRPFVNLEDLLGRVRISIDEGRALILSGACDGLGESRPAMLWQLAIRRHQQQHVAMHQPPATSLRTETPSNDAAAASQLNVPFPEAPAQQDMPAPVGDRGSSIAEENRVLPTHVTEGYSRRRLMELERQYLSFSPADHPLAAWRDELAGEDIVRSIDLPKYVGRMVTVAGIVVAMRRAVTKSREMMQFVSLEDRFGLIEVVLFPNVYRQMGGAFRRFGPYLVKGTVQENLRSVVLIGRSARLAPGLETAENKGLPDDKPRILYLDG